MTTIRLCCLTMICWARDELYEARLHKRQEEWVIPIYADLFQYIMCSFVFHIFQRSTNTVGLWRTPPSKRPDHSTGNTSHHSNSHHNTSPHSISYYRSTDKYFCTNISMLFNFNLWRNWRWHRYSKGIHTRQYWTISLLRRYSPSCSTRLVRKTTLHFFPFALLQHAQLTNHTSRISFQYGLWSD